MDPSCGCEFGDALDGRVGEPREDGAEVVAPRDLEPAAAFNHRSGWRPHAAQPARCLCGSSSCGRSRSGNTSWQPARRCCPKSAAGKACSYTLALWKKLTLLEYPQLEFNNLAENSMRPWRMDELFAIDREAREAQMDHAARHRLRQEKAPALLSLTARIDAASCRLSFTASTKRLRG